MGLADTNFFLTLGSVLRREVSQNTFDSVKQIQHNKSRRFSWSIYEQKILRRYASTPPRAKALIEE